MDDKFEEVQLHIDNVAGLGEQSLEKTKSGFLGLGPKVASDGAEEAQSKMPSATAEMQGKTQKMNMIFNAVTNIIKTSGQAGGQMASK